MLPEHQICSEVADVTSSIKNPRRRMAFSAPEVQQEVVDALVKKCSKEPEFRERLIRERKWRKYILTSLGRASGRVYSTLSVRLVPLLGDEILPPAALPADSVLARDDAGRFMSTIRAEVGPDGNFALDVLISGRPLSEHAQESGISARTAHRHFTNGLQCLRAAVCRLAKLRLGENVSNEFFESVAIMKRAFDPDLEENDMCTEQGNEIMRHLRRYRIRHGALCYRQRMARLSDWARRIVYMFESRGKPQQIIDALARQRFLVEGRELTDTERRQGEEMFVILLREIREVLEV